MSAEEVVNQIREEWNQGRTDAFEFHVSGLISPLTKEKKREVYEKLAGQPPAGKVGLYAIVSAARAKFNQLELF